MSKFLGSTMIAGFLEETWLELARKITGKPETSDALERLRPAVRHLSDLFTTERPKGSFPNYFADPELLVAYGLFFFPQSFERARLALDQAVRFRGWKPANADAALSAEPVRILDIGGGAGPCGFAIAEAIRALAPNRKIALTVLDHSQAALAAARELFARGTQNQELPENPAEFFRAVSIETICADAKDTAALSAKLPAQDVVIAGFCANELVSGGADALARWMQTLRPKLATNGLLIVLEPALRETALRIQNAADILTATGVFHEWAPRISSTNTTANAATDATAELAANAAASAAAAETSRFHPHEVRAWKPSDSLAFLNRELFRDAGSTLKFAYITLGTEIPAPLNAPEELLRLVSPLEALKGRLVCAVENVNRERLTIEIPTRGLSKSEVKKIAASCERGDILRIAPEHRLPIGRPDSALFRVESPALLHLAYTPNPAPIST